MTSYASCTSGIRRRRRTTGTPSGSCTATPRPRSRRCCSPSTRPGGRRGGGGVGRRPAGRAPSALPEAGARLRGDHPEGAHAGHPGPRRLRAADRPHQRRPGRGRRLRGSGHRPRAHRPGSRSGPWCATPSTSSPSTCRPTPPHPSGRRSPRPAPGRSATTTSRRSASAGQGRFRPLEGADPTVGTIGSLETVDEVRIEVVLDRALRRGRGRRDAGRPPLRGAGLRRGRARRPGRRDHRVRPDRHRRAHHAGRLRRGRSPRRSRRPPRACATPATPTAAYAGWPCVAEPATSCSTRCSPPTPTST